MRNDSKIIQLSVLLLLFFTTACAISTRKDITSAKYSENAVSQYSTPESTVDSYVDDISNQYAEVEPEDITPDVNTDEVMAEILAENAARLASSEEPMSEYGRIELPVNKYVKVWINYFTGRGRSHMTRYLSRSSKYIPKMKEILIKQGLPPDLVYLPVIESGFYTTAKSLKGATGYWQFMPGSGRDYGLTINRLVDERQDYVRSTQAAAKYLKRLYTLFGDWKLALSAYNAGENRVKRQLMNAETRDYWKLVERKSLYKETREYVPKFIAATLIAKSPSKFGFKNIPYQDVQKYQSMHVSRPLDLKKLAKNLGTSYKKLKKLNPRYRSAKVPVYRGKSALVRVPEGTLARAQIAAIKSYTTIPKRVYRPLEIFRYKVKKGDNLSKIAKRFGTTVKKIRRSNSLKRRSKLFVGKTLKIVRTSSNNKVKSKAGLITAKTSKKYRQIKKVHRVKRGENLSMIAKKHGVSLSQLLRFNGLRLRDNIKVGQKIKLTKAMTKESETRRIVNYKVKPGDNLQKISKRFGTTVHALKKQNGLKSNQINTEQRLKIVAKNIKMHIVKRGESLIAIANKYKVSMNNILKANNLRNKSKIQIGRTLRIPLVSTN